MTPDQEEVWDAVVSDVMKEISEMDQGGDDASSEGWARSYAESHCV
jgi:hypothetical protein